MEGGCIVYRAVGLTLRDFGAQGKPTLGPMVASILTEWEVANLNDIRAEADLARRQGVIQELLEESADVRELAAGAGRRFELLSDYGMGSLLIARVADGHTIWHHAPWRKKPWGGRRILAPGKAFPERFSSCGGRCSSLALDVRVSSEVRSPRPPVPAGVRR